MRGVDPRLLRRPGLRGYVPVLFGLGVLAALLVIVTAEVLARVLAAAAGGHIAVAVAVALGLATALSAAIGGLQGVVACCLSTHAKARLRADLLDASVARGPEWLAGSRSGELATLVGRGLDGLDGYLTEYLPRRVLAMTVPVAVLIRLAFADLASAGLVLLTLPLMPVFGALVGGRTQAAAVRQWRGLRRLGGHFADLVAGLPTLRAFGRSESQVDAVRTMADGYRAATMRTLRLAFLSSFVMELIAMVSVAIVAVPVGLRLLGGHLDLATGLLVFLLVPHAYAPLRAAAASFHASRAGLATLEDVFAVLTDPVEEAAAVVGLPPRPAPSTVDLCGAAIEFDGVTVLRGGRPILSDVSFRVEPGQRVALIGPSGAGKSTLLALLLGFVRPDSGRVLAGGVDLSTVDMADVRRQLAWVPQRPHLFATSVADNIRLGAPAATDADVRAAAVAAAADGFVAALPEGYAAPLGERGHGVSDGQRQRIALARAFLRADAPVLLLDEPTARLDAASEAAVLAAGARLLAGRTALVVAHRPALLAAVDRVLVVRAGRVREGHLVGTSVLEIDPAEVPA
jgi:ATP-binding cassette subfamily C protein CydD